MSFTFRLVPFSQTPTLAGVRQLSKYICLSVARSSSEPMLGVKIVTSRGQAQVSFFRLLKKGSPNTCYVPCRRAISTMTLDEIDAIASAAGELRAISDEMLDLHLANATEYSTYM